MNKPLPAHIGIIMDGNGRWAQKKGWPRVYGHREGVKTVKKIVKACGERGIAYLSLYAFSLENWCRPKKEVDFLMSLFEEYLVKERDELVQQNVRFRALGRVTELSQTIQSEIQKTEEITAGNSGLKLCLAVNYSGRAEIIDGIKKLVHSKIAAEQIDEALFSKQLYLPELPDLDLVLRTSGEYRISNFLLWKIAYAELMILDYPWPEFSPERLDDCLANYSDRDRRFGGVTSDEN